MPGAKRKRLEICSECKHATKPAINAAKLGHAQCLTTAYRDLGAFNERDDYGATPIHFAARFGKLECLEWLVTRSGVSPNAVSRNGATAAHDAAAMGHVGCLQYLLKSTKCSVHDTTSEGATVLHMACRFGRLDVVKWLMEFTDCTSGEKGANNVTPVHLCAAKDHLDCLKYLTGHSSYVANEQTSHGATPLYFAAQEGCVKALQWLVEEGGADLYLTASDGMCAVHAAAQAGQISCLEYLVEKGSVPVRHKANDGATPAHYAAASGQVECLDWIINHGGALYDRDNLGGTVAHDAAEQGQVSALKLLLDRGVDMETVDYEGLKPLDLARDNNHDECVQLLFKTVKPNILESLTPHQSLSRGATRDSQTSMEQAAKQRAFEQAMLSDVPVEKREAIWQRAQHQATFEAGLKHILDGGPSSAPPPDPSSTIHLTPATSMRHSRHSTATRLDNKDDPLSLKPRPPLSPELFQHPPADTGPAVSAESTGQKAPPTIPPQARKQPPTGPPAKLPLKRPPPKKQVRRPTSPPPKKVATRPTSPPAKRPTSPARRPTSPAKRPTSPPAKRPTSPPAKRPTSPAKRPTSPPAKRPTSPAKRPTSPARRPTSPPAKRPTSPAKRPTSPPAKRPTSPPAKRPTSPAKRPTSPPAKGPTSPPAKRPTSPTAKRPPPTKKVQSPKAVKSPPTKREVKRPAPGKPLAKKPPTKTVTKTPTALPPSKRQSSSSVGDKKRTSTETKPLQQTEPAVALSNVPGDVTTQAANQKIEQLLNDSLVPPTSAEGRPLSERGTQPLGDVEQFAEKIMERVIEESIATQNNNAGEVPTGGEVPVLEGEVVLRRSSTSEQPQPARGSGFKEEAVISKPPLRQSLKTGDETVTVTFMTKSSHIKSSFPVTHHQLLTGEDLESPGASDNEGGARDSFFTTPGYDHLDASNFDDFGTAVKVRPVEVDKDKSEDVVEVDKDKSEDVVKTLDLDEDKEATDGLNDVDNNDSQPKTVPWPKPNQPVVSAEPAPNTPLTRWTNRHSLDAMGKKKAVNNDTTEQKKDVGSDVLKLMNRFQDNRKSQAKDEATKAANQIVASKVSDRLKMFGGGVSFRSESPAEPPSGGRGRSESPGESPCASRDASPGLSKTRRSSSALSVTAFETIAEESPSGGEGEDKVTPLPSIQHTPSRRNSEEKLRLDGLKLEDLVSSSKSDGSGNKPPSPPSLGQRRHSGGVVSSQRRHSGGVVSPLLISSSPKPNRASVPVYNGSEAMAVFMNSAGLPHLDHLRERNEREMSITMDTRVGLLLATPRMTGVKVPVEFRSVNFGDKGKLHVWKQKAGSLNKLASLDSLTFDPKAVFLFLHTPSHGPHIHTVYVWVGAGVSHFAVQSAYQHTMRLIQCTPGTPLIIKEFQGHESAGFLAALKRAGKPPSEFHQSYLNTSLKTSRLVVYTDSSFKTHTGTLDKQTSPALLDTAVGLWVWLPASYWGQSPLEISELYISQNNYPKWTPVTVVTEGVETQEFAAHFSSWSWVDLSRGQRSSELCLPDVRPPLVTYPATGQIKAWRLEGGGLTPVGLGELGVFWSTSLYLVQYCYLKQSQLYTWMEGAVYVWVGAGLPGNRKALVNQALNKVESITTTKLPVVMVPEGLEPEQLLNLFKGQCIIHKSPQDDSVGLYRVSGTSVLTMKAVQVTPPTVSSLNSSHTFILRGREGMWYVWAGQFSSVAQRRGGLIIANTLAANSAKGVVTLAEGLETAEFWAELGGKGRHAHFDLQCSPPYLLPHLYACESGKDTTLFIHQLPTNRADLETDHAYLLSYKEQLFVWTGVDWKGESPLQLVEAYLSQYHSRRSEDQYVLTLVSGGNEGAAFWRWFDIQNPGVTPPPDVPAMDIAMPTSDEDLDPSHSMVVVEEPEHTVPPAPVEAVPSVVPPPPSVVPPAPPAVPPAPPPPPSVVPPAPSVDDGRPLSLTPSQVVTVERVETLQSELTKLVEGEASVSCDGVEGEASVSCEGTSPLRTSEAIHQMSELVDGLDNMLQMSATPTTQEATPTGIECAEASSVSLQVPPIDTLLDTPEDDNLPTPPLVIKKSKKQSLPPAPPPSKSKKQSLPPAPPPSMLVEVEVEAKGLTVQVRVREKAPVITLMFRAARSAGLSLTTNSALFEVVSSLKLCRSLEDHELVRDVIAVWPKKDPPKLLLREFATKNVLWSDNPPIPAKDISAYVRRGTVPQVSSKLLYSTKGAGHLPWKEGNFSLRTLGIYTVTQSKRKGSEVSLMTSLDHTLYIPLVEGNAYTTATLYTFIMKPPNSWREKDLTFYSAPSLPVMSQWIHVRRLFKHGVQLKANYIAMKTRVQKQERKEQEQP